MWENTTTLAESCDNSEIHFQATTTQINHFQEALRDLAWRIPASMKDVPIEKTHQLTRQINMRFLEAYAAEFAPDWKTATYPQNFLEATRTGITINPEQLKLAFILTRHKVEEKLAENKTLQPEDWQEIAGFIYPALTSETQSDMAYDWAKEFTEKFRETFVK